LDLWPALTQGAPSPHDAILCVSTQGPVRAAVRMGEWKLLQLNATEEAAEDEADGAKAKAKGKAAKATAKYEPLALYHLTEDPSETKNLAATQPERVKAMQAKLAALLKDAVPPGNMAPRK
jgi:arylsulfatase A-like enzyme